MHFNTILRQLYNYTLIPTVGILTILYLIEVFKYIAIGTMNYNNMLHLISLNLLNVLRDLM